MKSTHCIGIAVLIFAAVTCEGAAWDSVRRHPQRLALAKRLTSDPADDAVNTHGADAKSRGHSRPSLREVEQRQQHAIADRFRTAIFASNESSSGQCDVCSNGAACCSGEQCCSNGTFCCSNTTTCCSDTCCNGGEGPNAETCCPDPVHGGVCCEAQQTFCCAPSPQHELPSRCCPRWYVCCNGGRYGCCDPDTMAPMESNVGHALFLEPNWLTGGMEFDAATVDLASGAYVQELVTGFHTGGEITRTFMFDRQRAVFMLPQANFTAATNSSHGDPDRVVHLYTIDAAKGNLSRKEVVGAHDEVTGYHYCEELAVIVLSTFSYNSTGGRNGFVYYHLDPLTAVATRISSSLFNTSNVDEWSGWFHEVAADCTTAYRLGYEDVVRSVGFGVETVDLSTDPARSTFKVIPDPTGYSHYRSLNKLKPSTITRILQAQRGRNSSSSANHLSNFAGAENGTYFVSLASSYNTSTFYDLGVFAWNLGNVSEAAVFLGLFPNAHRAPYFGPINEALDEDRLRYSTVVVQSSLLGTSYDTWAVGVVDLTGAKNVTELTLTPWLLAASSVSGFGIPSTDSSSVLG